MAEDGEFDWDMILKEIETVETAEDECGNKVKSIFLGSTFSLTPSGKYYTPWASANVTDEEAEEDEKWWKRLEEEASKHGLWITSGEGDPTDLYVGKTIEEEPGGQRCLMPTKPMKTLSAEHDLKAGDMVYLEGEGELVFKVLEAQDERGPMPRILVEAQLPDWKLKPTERVDIKYVTKTDPPPLSPPPLPDSGRARRIQIKGEPTFFSTSWLDYLIENGKIIIEDRHGYEIYNGPVEGVEYIQNLKLGTLWGPSKK